MSEWSYTPQIWRDRDNDNPFAGAEFDELVKRARECLLWRMTPAYYDNMTMKEYLAWHKAWADLNKEKGD